LRLNTGETPVPPQPICELVCAYLGRVCLCDGFFAFILVIMIAMQPAVFLDRDNTIIHNDGDLGDPALVRLIQGAASAIASLQGLGYKIVVVTNQGGVARGKFTEKDVQATNERVNELVRQTSGGSIDRFYYCPYHPQGTVEQYKREHAWRKPQPGMLTQAAADLQIDLAQSWMVGDQMRDIEAGMAAGVRTVLLREDAEELTPLKIEQLGNAHAEQSGDEPRVGPHFSARSLIEAVRIIAQQRNPEAAERNKRSMAEEARRRRDVTDRFRPDQAEGVSAATSQPRPADVRGAAPRSRATISGPGPERRETAAATEPAPRPSLPPPPAPVAKPVSPPKPLEVSAPRVEAEVEVAPRQEPEKQASTAPVTAPPKAAPVAVTPPEAPVPSATTPAETTLRQILQELRSQRSETDDFSYLRVVAIVLQVIAIVCLLGGLWLGMDDINTFLRWGGAALCVQLAVIATLMFDR
jgi:D-glycero-D-manno-heptose 1,7-bisphosphate phosphatase